MEKETRSRACLLSGIILCCFMISLLGFSEKMAEATGSINVGIDESCVILLHGMARTPSSMKRLEKYLAGKGYKTVNLAYPSTSESIKNLTETYIPKAIQQCGIVSGGKVHFVTHSLGGILVRQYLQSHDLPKGSRVVMLAPPNGGSEIVDYLKKYFIYRWFHGPAGQELGTNPGSTPNRLLPVDIEIGVIAGDRSLNPIFSSLIPGPDDGKVSLKRAKLKEMKDFIAVSSSHTFIMNNRNVMSQVGYFLEHGRFNHIQKKN